MRTGTVVYYNKALGLGCIKDINDQKIRFLQIHNPLEFNKGEEVGFRIALVHNRLTAVEVRLLNTAEKRKIKRETESVAY